MWDLSGCIVSNILMSYRLLYHLYYILYLTALEILSLWSSSKRVNINDKTTNNSSIDRKRCTLTNPAYILTPQQTNVPTLAPTTAPTQLQPIVTLLHTHQNPSQVQLLPALIQNSPRVVPKVSPVNCHRNRLSLYDLLKSLTILYFSVP